VDFPAAAGRAAQRTRSAFSSRGNRFCTSGVSQFPLDLHHGPLAVRAAPRRLLGQNNARSKAAQAGKDCCHNSASFWLVASGTPTGSGGRSGLVQGRGAARSGVRGRARGGLTRGAGFGGRGEAWGVPAWRCTAVVRPAPQRNTSSQSRGLGCSGAIGCSLPPQLAPASAAPNHC